MRRTVMHISVVLTAALLATTVQPAVATGQAAGVDFDPRLALLPIGAAAGTSTAQADANRAARGKVRAAQRIADGQPKIYPEKEPAGTFGANDTVAKAEAVPGFGTSHGNNPKASIRGDLALGTVPRLPQADEDNGAIPLAADTGLVGVRKIVKIPGVIGDGPHGSAGDGHGDFDFYKVSGASFGTPVSVDVNTSMFGGNGGQRDLSPLSAFLPNWGLTASDENKLIDAVVASVKENMSRDLAARGTNRNFGIRILNSRDNADPFGRPDVSRVIVGGSVAESGINTIGIAQSIDPGNFGHKETALLLLDYVSRPAPDPNSFNTFLAPGADKIAFIGRALGNYVSHEAGHFSGSWHTMAPKTH